MFFALLRYIWFGANKYSKVITSKTRHFTHIIFGFYVVLMVFLIFYKQVPNELLKITENVMTLLAPIVLLRFIVTGAEIYPSLGYKKQEV